MKITLTATDLDIIMPECRDMNISPHKLLLDAFHYLKETDQLESMREKQIDSTNKQTNSRVQLRN